MSAHVLVVDDDLPLAQALGDMVASMDHTYELAADVETARKKLEKGKFDLLLLDMNLPMAPGRMGRRENGRNFIEIIRKTMGMKDLPIIVVTGEDGGEAEFILSVVKSGGIGCTQYIQKPIEGDKIDRAVRQALEGPAPEAAPSAPAPAPAQPIAGKATKLEPFSGAVRKLCIYPDKVKLCGITVWTDKGTPDMRDALLLLKEKPDGRYIRIDGSELMERINRELSNPISGPIRSFRTRVTVQMAEHCGLECGTYDVIDSRGGYHLQDWIEVQVADHNSVDEELGAIAGATDESNGAEPPSSSAKLAAEMKGLPDKQIERLISLCLVLRDGSSRDFDALQRLTRVSRSQNTRDIAALTELGLMEKTGPQKGREYRLTSRASDLLQ